MQSDTFLDYTLGPTRTLFHFTYPERVDNIVHQGIFLTDIPTSPTNQGYRGVWLTEDPNPYAQGWARSAGLSGKAGARITVDIPHEILGPPYILYRWLDLAKHLEVEDFWLNAMNQAGGGGQESWWVSLVHVPPEWVSYWEILQHG
jgi:hypothetical protein